MKPLISVIVPVYNVEKFLDKNISSITNQTYKNLEIILLNDGSTDNSGIICDYYAKQDERIHIIHKKNSGVADTRNYGISISRGEYYCFIDSDDYITQDYIEQLYNAIETTDSDIACCSFSYVYADGKKYSPVCKENDKSYIKVTKGSDVLENMLYGKSEFVPGCVCKLFRRKSVGNIIFPEYRIGEDFIAALDYYNSANKVVYINKPLYLYFQNDKSAMHSANPDKYYDRVLSSDEIYRIATKLNPALKKAASHYMIEMNMIVLMKIQDCNDKQKFDHITENIKKYRYHVIFDNKARPRIRISAIVSLFGIKFLCKIRNLTTK